METVSLSMSSSLMKGAHSIQQSAINQLFRSGTQTANAILSATEAATRNSVMQAQGVGQNLNLTV